MPASPAPFIRINVLEHGHEVVAQFAARVPAHLVEQAREIDEAVGFIERAAGRLFHTARNLEHRCPELNAESQDGRSADLRSGAF